MNSKLRHHLLISAGLAAVAVTPALAAEPSSGPGPTTPGASSMMATRATPAMLATVDAKSPGAKTIMVGRSAVVVSPGQMSAYNSLSPEIKGKLGPAVQGKVLSQAELNKLKDIANKAGSTVMCPW